MRVWLSQYYGGWGSGKSSVKNLVLEKLTEQKYRTVTAVEFNPWLVSGEETITSHASSGGKEPTLPKKRMWG